ncbi:hypothetical protein [Streptomyces sp. CAU 1734]|uniref:hypothetical protein n=1 Tax=Streptomyces sp. CAU 1734 TaxID=3140360 RepID=UPI003260A716
MRTREMRRLCAHVAGNLRLPIPSEPDRLFTALGAVLTALREREVRILFLHFPPGTVTGLWADRGDHDLIVVEECAPPQHQLVILGHEIWHMHAGHRGGHAAGAAAARASVPGSPARNPRGRRRALGLLPPVPHTPAGAAATRPPDNDAALAPQGPGAPGTAAAALREVLADTAARTGFAGAEESAAELFGIMLGSELRPWLEGLPGEAAPPADGLAGRIRVSLGRPGAVG